MEDKNWLEELKSQIDEKFYKGNNHPIAFTVGDLKNLLSELPDELRLSENTCKVIVFSINDNPILEFMEEDF